MVWFTRKVWSASQSPHSHCVRPDVARVIDVEVDQKRAGACSAGGVGSLALPETDD